jgi:magnesium chelatase subunit I
MVASTTGKIELETMGEVREDRIVEKLIQGGIASTFNKYFSVRDFDDLILGFDNGLTVDVADDMPSMNYVHQVSHMDGMREAIAKLDVAGSPAGVASAVEFILEGLHLNRRLNKDRSDGAGGAQYKA